MPLNELDVPLKELSLREFPEPAAKFWRIRSKQSSAVEVANLGQKLFVVWMKIQDEPKVIQVHHFGFLPKCARRMEVTNVKPTELLLKKNV